MTTSKNSPMLRFFKFAILVWLLGINRRRSHESRGLHEMYECTNVTRPLFLHYTMWRRAALASAWEAAKREKNCPARLNTPIDFKMGLMDALPETYKPVVLNFGSISCPPFRCELKNFNKLVERFHSRFEFVNVYIAEAHPIDGWYIGDLNARVTKHVTEQDRAQSAAIMAPLIHDKGFIICDKMDDSYAKFFGVMYGRLAVIDHGVLVYLGDNGPFGYDLDDLEAFLEIY